MEKSFTETLVGEVHGKAFPGRVFDIALIIPLVTAILNIVKACQESRKGAAKEAMQRQTLSTRIALRRTIRREHPELDGSEQRELFRASLERLAAMTDDEIDCVVQEAEDSAVVLD